MPPGVEPTEDLEGFFDVGEHGTAFQAISPDDAETLDLVGIFGAPASELAGLVADRQTREPELVLAEHLAGNVRRGWRVIVAGVSTEYAVRERLPIDGTGTVRLLLKRR